MNSWQRVFTLLFLSFLVGGCGQSVTAPDAEYSAIQQVPVNREYTVFIAQSGSFLPADIHSQLDLIVNDIKKLPRVYGVEVIGYTDNFGSELENLLLSLRRSGAVGELLMEKGIDDGLVSFDGFGELFPVADNSTERGRAKNRRVEIHVSGQDWVSGENLNLVSSSY